MMKVSMNRRTIIKTFFALVVLIGLVELAITVIRFNTREVLLFEDFNEPESLKPYLARQDFFAENGQLKVMVGTPSTGCSTFVPGQYTDFVLETQVFPLGDVADASSNFTFRYNEKGWYEVWLRPDKNQVQLLKFAQDGDGNTQGLLSLSNGWLDVREGIFNPTEYKVKLSVQGNTFEVWVNNRHVLKITDTETPYLSGRVQIGAGTGEVGGIAFTFDDLKIFDR